MPAMIVMVVVTPSLRIKRTFILNTAHTSLVALLYIQTGGDGVTLLETRPLEDILADIAEGWDSTRRCMGRGRASEFTEVSYVL